MVKGEPDVTPFTKFFEFSDQDEPIFLNVIEMIKNKLSRNLRLNVHEALLAYCAYLVSEIRSRRSDSNITNNSSKVLTQNDVLIGVPETLRDIKFDIAVDNFPKKTIQFIKPIPIVNYIMGVHGAIGVTNCEKSS
ncbi:MAG: urease subunit gamma [Thaumarchaeota archaeon]|nr:urease subunit gamma [Nitrososphaerota archaeon]MDE1866520.1 urease subunit gamma [Nitrososphaerota archaeon]